MSDEIVELLDKCQSLLERHGRWQTQPPAPDKMMSTAPFSVDTLTFLEWLQWVYIARLRAIIEAGATLPRGAKVAPYADESLRADGDPWPELVNLIERLDDMI